MGQVLIQQYLEQLQDLRRTPNLPGHVYPVGSARNYPIVFSPHQSCSTAALQLNIYTLLEPAMSTTAIRLDRLRHSTGFTVLDKPAILSIPSIEKEVDR
jgi:hypothetical protein